MNCQNSKYKIIYKFSSILSLLYFFNMIIIARARARNIHTHTRWSFENREEGILYLRRRLVEILSCARPSRLKLLFHRDIHGTNRLFFPSREAESRNKKLQCQLYTRSGREAPPPSPDRSGIPLLD